MCVGSNLASSLGILVTSIFPILIQVIMNNLLMNKMHVKWQEEWEEDKDNIGYGINGFTIVNLAEADVCR